MLLSWLPGFGDPVQFRRVFLLFCTALLCLLRAGEKTNPTHGVLTAGLAG